MPSTPACLTLMLLVDALRPDYVSRMPYLRELARSGAVGRLRECFGFVPRAAYFGGLNAETYGFTNMFSFDPANSPFSMARYLPAAPQGAVLEQQAGLRQAVENSARDRLGPFAKAYAASAEIPMDFLPYFNLVERRAPWDPQTGYTSLFARLDEAGCPWHERSWPGTNQLDDASDDGIVHKVLEDLRPEHRFSYVHLQQLDGHGHVHGPQSAFMHKQIAAMDRRCRLLIETLKKRYQRLHLLLFGDHGMVNVTRTLDVREILRDLDLTFGVDYAYFLDSSMVRFWFHHPRARSVVQNALAPVSGGRLLQDEDLRHFGIAGCDARNAELIFLADPGVLVFPNFFQGHGDPIKGMHGYDPDCPDNLGYFLIHSPDWPELAGQVIGKVDPSQLFHLAGQLVGLPGRSEVDALLEKASPQPAHRFTACPDPAGERLIEDHLQTIAQAVRDQLGEFDAIILTGSFGRGEGGVYQDESGRWRPVNDYDLLVVASRPPSDDPARLGRELSSQLGIDFVDLGWTQEALDALPLTVSHYDLKHGSQVIAGHPDVLDRLPDFSAAEMPVYEAVKLLLNRAGGILSGLRGSQMTDPSLAPESSCYLINQIVKAHMARGDWHLIRWQGYDSSYRLRRQRFASLAPGAGLDAASTSAICRAYELKCQPDYQCYPDPLAELDLLQPGLQTDIIHSVSLMTETGLKRVGETMARYLEFMSAEPGLRRAENQLVARHPEWGPRWRGGDDAPVSCRHLVFSVIPLLLHSFDRRGDAPADESRGEAYGKAIEVLSPWMEVPDPGPWNPENWEELRAFVVRAWFALCH